MKEGKEERADKEKSEKKKNKEKEKRLATTII